MIVLLNRKVFWSVTGSFLLAAVTSQWTIAQIPQTLNYQGKLTQNNQLFNGVVPIEFCIYNVNTGGTALWCENHAAVQVTNGQFTVELGTVVAFSTIPLEFDEKYYLGINVDNDGEMVPRKPLTSVGYALNAVHAQESDHSMNSDNANNAQNAQNAQNASNAQNAQNANKSNKSDFALGVKESKVAIVAVGLRSGDTPTPTSAIYADPVAALNDVGTWCGTPAQSSPCLLRVMAGEYNLGAADLTMIPWVDVEGAGENATRILTTGSVLPSQNSALRFLTVEKTGGTGAAITVDDDAVLDHLVVRATVGTHNAISVIAAAPRLSHLTLIGKGDPTLEIQGAIPYLNDVRVEGEKGILLTNNSSPRFTNVDILVSSASQSVVGIEIQNQSNPVLQNVTITADASLTTGLPAVGITNSESSPLLRGVTIESLGGNGGDAVGMRNANGGSPSLNDVFLSAVATGTGLAIGFDNFDADAELIRTTIKASGPGTSVSYAVRNDQLSEIRIDHSVLRGDTFAFRREPSTAGSQYFIAGSRLVGQVSSGASQFTCLNNYNEALQPLDPDCQP